MTGVATPMAVDLLLPGVSALWKVLTSVRIALVVILLIAAAACAGLLLPQAPQARAVSPEMEGAWLDQQRATFGILTPVLQGTGLFDVFDAPWFLALLAWLAVSIVCCTAGRLPKLTREVFHPPLRIPEALFTHGTAGSVVPVADPELGKWLRRHRFRIRTERVGGTTYIFADRWAWAVLGTVFTHLALVLVLLGALVSRLDGSGESLAIAEGRTAPVLAAGSTGQLLVGVDQALGTFGPAGNPLDFRTTIVLTERGADVKRCTVTVNGPCSYGGYTFHQAGYFNMGAELVVRDAASGAVLYHESLPLQGAVAAARILVTDQAGRTIFAGALPETQAMAAESGALLDLGGGLGVLWLDLRGQADGWNLLIVDAGQQSPRVNAALRPGEAASIGGLRLSFEEVVSAPSAIAQGIPVSGGDVAGGSSPPVLLALVDGRTGRALKDQDARPVLHLAGLGSPGVRIREGEVARVGPYEYEFVRQSSFAGVLVRRDRGDELIWFAGILLVAGLTTTLWLPRRRAWFRIQADGEVRMYSAGSSRLRPEDIDLR